MKHNGNLTFKQILDVARTMRKKSIARTFTGTVKEILGCVAAAAAAPPCAAHPSTRTSSRCLPASPLAPSRARSTAFSVGCTVDGKSPRDISAAIDADEIEVPEA